MLKLSFTLNDTEELIDVDNIDTSIVSVQYNLNFSNLTEAKMEICDLLFNTNDGVEKLWETIKTIDIHKVNKLNILLDEKSIYEIKQPIQNIAYSMNYEIDGIQKIITITFE